MTYQRDPERPIPDDDIVRRENIASRDAEIARRRSLDARPIGPMPIILTVLILLGAGYFAYSTLHPRTVSDTPRTTEVSPTVPVTPAPAPRAPSTAPQTK